MIGWWPHETPTEQHTFWTLHDTGLRVDELRSDCPQTSSGSSASAGARAALITKKTKVRVAPISRRVRALRDRRFALHNDFPVQKWPAQDLVKKVANRAILTVDERPGRATIPRVFVAYVLFRLFNASRTRPWKWLLAATTPRLAVNSRP